MKSYLILLIICAFTFGSLQSFAASKFIGVGNAKRNKNFKTEVTIFEAEEDPQPKCIGCRNYRVIVDIFENQEFKIGVPYPTAVEFETCGTAADKSPIAELVSIWRHKGSALMTRSHPALLMQNYSDKDCTSVMLNLLGKKCLNLNKKECREYVVVESFKIPVSKLNTNFEDVSLDEDPLPNLTRNRVPSSTTSKK